MCSKQLEWYCDSLIILSDNHLGGWYMHESEESSVVFSRIVELTVNIALQIHSGRACTTHQQCCVSILVWNTERTVDRIKCRALRTLWSSQSFMNWLKTWYVTSHCAIHYHWCMPWHTKCHGMRQGHGIYSMKGTLCTYSHYMSGRYLDVHDWHGLCSGFRTRQTVVSVAHATTSTIPSVIPTRERSRPSFSFQKPTKWPSATAHSRKTNWNRQALGAYFSIELQWGKY